MKDLLEVIGISKQAVHQHNIRQLQLNANERLVLEKARVIREKHPRMGCRTMHLLMADAGIGRDRCEQLLLSKGFRLKRYSNPFKTTHSQRIYRYPDLINGLRIRGINRVWQTDITYYITGNSEVFYIIFIEDVYSRRIIGRSAQDHMKAEANIACLNQAFQIRKNHSLTNLIHHSDFGGQYVSKDYLLALQSRKIKISMCSQGWQNAYTERINGIIKNDYLKAWRIESLSDLRTALVKAVDAYNYEKPHRNLPDKMSPVKFEEYLAMTPSSRHPWLKIYKYDS